MNFAQLFEENKFSWENKPLYQNKKFKDKSLPIN